MIPKIIHHCWFGGEMPDRVKNCIATWIPHLWNRGYKIICWNESKISAFVGSRNIDYALEHHLYAVLADIIRCWALYTYGGIYLDTDVRLCDSFDRILNLRTYIGLERVVWPRDGRHFIDRKFISTAILGTQPGNLVFKRCFDKMLNYDLKDIHGPSRRVIGIPFYESLEETSEFRVVNSIEEAKQYEGENKVAIFNAPQFDSYVELSAEYSKIQNYKIADHLYFNSWVENETILP